uniref:Uncharacterized protein n=2 Tax=Ixodes scapularis TaxID=6945 RepID=A0A1S4KV30_IXOSC
WRHNALGGCFCRYFDRNQAHPYENSSKYSSKATLGSRYNDKVRESPSNGSSHGRMGSPDSRHSYHKSSYSQRPKERDHERGMEPCFLVV